jgi:hypothetical protein
MSRPRMWRHDTLASVAGSATRGRRVPSASMSDRTGVTISATASHAAAPLRRAATPRAEALHRPLHPLATPSPLACDASVSPRGGCLRRILPHAAAHVQAGASAAITAMPNSRGHAASLCGGLPAFLACVAAPSVRQWGRRPGVIMCLFPIRCTRATPAPVQATAPPASAGQDASGAVARPQHAWGPAMRVIFGKDPCRGRPTSPYRGELYGGVCSQPQGVGA